MKKKTKLTSSFSLVVFTFTLLIIFHFSFFISNCFSQPQQEWVERYNSTGNYDDYIQDMVLDDSGNVYITGYIYKSSSDQDFITLKYSSQGILLWARTYDGNDHREDKSYSIAVDDSGNVYVTGFTHTDQTFRDYLTIKYNSNGDSIWSRRYNNQYNQYDMAYELVLDDSSNVFVTGESYFEGQSSNILTIKYDRDGNQKWIRTYNGTMSGYDRPWDMNGDNLGYIYITGSTADSGSLTTIKYSNDGIEKWVTHDYNRGRKVSIDEYGNVYVAGEYYDSNVRYDYNTIKYDSNGMKIWQRTYGSISYNNNDYLKDMVIDDSSNAYVTGLSSVLGRLGWDYLTIKYNDNGDSLWTRRFNPVNNSDDRPYSIAVDKNGNVFITGSSDYNFLGSKYTTVVYSKNGNQEYVLNYDNNNPYYYHEAIKVKIDDNNNIYITGNSQGVGTGYDIATLKYSPITSTIQAGKSNPYEFELFQNYPNPFNSSTLIRFNISRKSVVSLRIYDIAGNHIYTLIHKELNPGKYKSIFVAQSIASGVYFYNLYIDGIIIHTKKLVFIK